MFFSALGITKDYSYNPMVGRKKRSDYSNNLSVDGGNIRAFYEKKSTELGKKYVYNCFERKE